MNAAPACPIYTVGDGTRTQMALRADGVWFKRTKGVGARVGLWGHWEECGKVCPYEFGKYVDRKAGNARLPHEPI